MEKYSSRGLLKISSFRKDGGTQAGNKDSLLLSLSASREDESSIGFHGVFMLKYQTQAGLPSTKTGLSRSCGMKKWRPSQVAVG